MEQTGLTRQGVERRMKVGAGSLTFQSHVVRRMRATADLMEEKALAAKIEVQKLKDSIITREQVRRDADAVGKIWIAEINKMRKQAVAQLTNMDEIGVRQRLDTITDALLERILQRMEKL